MVQRRPMLMLELTRWDIAARALVVVFLALFAFQASAQSRREGARSGPGTGNPDEHLVPWLFLSKAGAPTERPLVLYWLPASREEIDRSSLINSRVLLQDANRCLGLEIVLPDDAATIEKLGATGRLPTALLVDAQGTVVRRVESARGALSATAVEQMVRDELSSRDDRMYLRITEAKRLAGNGDRQGAIDLYKKLWDERCLFPLAGREAQRSLKEIGVTVVEPPAPKLVDPNLAVVPKTATAPPGHAGRD